VEQIKLSLFGKLIGVMRHNQLLFKMQVRSLKSLEKKRLMRETKVFQRA